jgi:hypothetical protein
MSRLWYRLDSLVRESSDPSMIQYVITHLGEGVPPPSRYTSHMQKWREEHRLYLTLLLWDPVRTLSSPLRYGVKSPALKQMQERQQAYQKMLRKAEQQAALKNLLQALAIEQIKQNEILAQMLRDLVKEKPDVITEKLKDEQPLVRWLAAHAAGRKRLPVEDKLIDLFADAYPQVREAARQALVRISRGNDFGPAQNANAKQVTQASQTWRQWHRWQDPPESSLEAVPPQPANKGDPP